MIAASLLKPWAICYRKTEVDPAFRLFCLPYAGGSASVFRDWPDRLPQSVEVCAIQLPGRETRLKEPVFTRLPPLVQELAQALLPSLDRPFALFGHSVGALFGGVQDREVSEAALWAWQEQTSRSFRVRMLRGNHFFVHSSQTDLVQAVYADLMLYPGGEQ